MLGHVSEGATLIACQVSMDLLLAHSHLVNENEGLPRGDGQRCKSLHRFQLAIRVDKRRRLCEESSHQADVV